MTTRFLFFLNRRVSFAGDERTEAPAYFRNKLINDLIFGQLNYLVTTNHISVYVITTNESAEKNTFSK